MNMHSEHDGQAPSTDALRLHLAGLPEPGSQADLWPRIERTRARRRVGRRIAAAGALCAVAVAGLFGLRMTAVNPGLLADAAPPATPLVSADLRMIDHQLQAAYDHAADPEHINALWHARELAASATDTRSIEDDHIISL